jgi:CBS domain-containing protein
MEVKDITKPAISINEDLTFKEAIETMVIRQTNSLLVTNKKGVLVGEVSMADILDATIPDYLDGDTILKHFASSEAFAEAIANASDLVVKDFMTTDITPVESTDSLITVAASAIASRRTHLPVVDRENIPIGVISRRGIKHIIANALGIPDSE